MLILTLLFYLLALVPSIFSHPCEVQNSFDYEDQYIPLASECCQYLINIRTSLSDFVACSVWNSKPFKICEQCIEQYRKVQCSQEQLSSDTAEYNGTTCSEQLLSSDKEHTIFSLLEEATDIWSTSQCDKCYETSASSASIPLLSNETQKFFKLNNLTYTCFANEQKLPHGDVCVSCKQFYRNQNDYFSSLGDSSSSICMDIVEMMNITRQVWSVRYDCLNMYEDPLPIAFLISFIALLPILLYGGAAILENKHRTEILERKPRMYEEITSMSSGSLYTNDGYLGSFDEGAAGGFSTSPRVQNGRIAPQSSNSSPIGVTKMRNTNNSDSLLVQKPTSLT